MISIKQGDAFALPVEVRLADGGINIADIESVEFMFNDIRKVYPQDARYDAVDGLFYVPLTQQDTFSFPADETALLDIRVHFVGGDVLGIQQKQPIYVYDATSEVVL